MQATRQYSCNMYIANSGPHLELSKLINRSPVPIDRILGGNAARRQVIFLEWCDRNDNNKGTGADTCRPVDQRKNRRAKIDANFDWRSCFATRKKCQDDERRHGANYRRPDGTYWNGGNTAHFGHRIRHTAAAAAPPPLCCCSPSPVAAAPCCSAVVAAVAAAPAALIRRDTKLSDLFF